MEAAKLAEDLGYRSLSAFMNDLLREALDVAQIAKELGQSVTRRSILTTLFMKIKNRLKSR